MDDWGRLLSGCGANNSTQGSNPCLPASLALVAQWIERLVADQKVAGSNPAEGTRDRIPVVEPFTNRSRRPTANRDKAIVSTPIDTGLRASEICSLLRKAVTLTLTALPVSESFPLSQAA